MVGTTSCNLDLFVTCHCMTSPFTVRAFALNNDPVSSSSSSQWYWDGGYSSSPGVTWGCFFIEREVPLDVFILRGLFFLLSVIHGSNIVHHPHVFFFYTHCCSTWFLLFIVREIRLDVTRQATSKTHRPCPFLTSHASQLTVFWPHPASFRMVCTGLHHRQHRM